MAHTCKVCFVRCMDFRLEIPTRDLREQLKIKDGEFDLVSLSGGAGVREEPSRVLNDIELSVRLHKAAIIVLTGHEDCGKGGARNVLKTLFADVKRLYLSLTVRAFWATRVEGNDSNWTWEEIK